MGETVIIEKLVSGGWGLARTAEGIVLVDGTLPGEQVEIHLLKRSRGVANARVSRILKASGDRRIPPCKVHQTCGGCGFQYAGDNVQTELKAAWVKESLKRIGGIDIDELPIVKGQSWNYRHRAQIHSDGKNKRGFLAEASHEIVPVEQCPVLQASLNAYLDPVHSFWKSRPPGRYLFTAQGLNSWSAEDEEGILTLNGQDFHFPASGFVQSNLELTELLRAKVLAIIQDRIKEKSTEIWDLYGGAGTWSQLPALDGYKVRLVEENPEAKTPALKNCPGSIFETGSVENFLGIQKKSARFILADPPRTGLSNQVREHVVRLKPEFFLYISCHGDTFARDAKDLLKAGYILDQLSLWDFYPQTFHVEIVSLWVKQA